MKKLLLYTGPVKSGKSSRLLSFVKSRKDYGGILSPVFDGKKYLYDIQSGERRLLEADISDSETEIIRIGSYKFRKKVFEWGRNILQKTSYENNLSLVIDEAGPLEFSGEGLSPAASEIIKNYSNYSQQVIIVVRESLLDEFLKHYKIKISEIDFFSFGQ